MTAKELNAKKHIYIISDATGITAERVIQAISNRPAARRQRCSDNTRAPRRAPHVFGPLDGPGAAYAPP